jgi:hypothetical protein
MAFAWEAGSSATSGLDPAYRARQDKACRNAQLANVERRVNIGSVASEFESQE